MSVWYRLAHVDDPTAAEMGWGDRGGGEGGSMEKNVAPVKVGGSATKVKDLCFS